MAAQDGPNRPFRKDEDEAEGEQKEEGVEGEGGDGRGCMPLLLASVVFVCWG